MAAMSAGAYAAWDRARSYKTPLDPPPEPCQAMWAVDRFIAEHLPEHSRERPALAVFFRPGTRRNGRGCVVVAASPRQRELLLQAGIRGVFAHGFGLALEGEYAVPPMHCRPMSRRMFQAVDDVEGAVDAQVGTKPPVYMHAPLRGAPCVVVRSAEELALPARSYFYEVVRVAA